MIKRICSGLLCMKNMKWIVIISIFTLVLVNTACGAETSATNRPAHWAKPIQIKGALPTFTKSPIRSIEAHNRLQRA